MLLKPATCGSTKAQNQHAVQTASHGEPRQQSSQQAGRLLCVPHIVAVLGSKGQPRKRALNVPGARRCGSAACPRPALHLQHRARDRRMERRSATTQYADEQGARGPRPKGALRPKLRIPTLMVHATLTKVQTNSDPSLLSSVAGAVQLRCRRATRLGSPRPRWALDGLNCWTRCDEAGNGAPELAVGAPNLVPSRCRL